MSKRRKIKEYEERKMKAKKQETISSLDIIFCTNSASCFKENMQFVLPSGLSIILSCQYI